MYVCLIVIILLTSIIIFLLARIRAHKNNTIQILSGSGLDVVAKTNYNIERIPGECDSKFRTRIKDLLKKLLMIRIKNILLM